MRRPLTVARSTDSTRINAIINHPAVAPWVLLPGQTNVDLGPLIAEPQNVLLMHESWSGGFFFHQHEPGVYEVHSNFLPEARGLAALQGLRDAMWWMFTRTDCMEILTKVPVNNTAADHFARAAGGVLEFTLRAMWPVADGTNAVDIRYYAHRYYDWVKTVVARRDLAAAGHWFHERLEAEKKRVGVASPIHDDDEAHDIYVGAAVEMIFGGVPGKAVVLYNRWGRFAGYAPVAIVSIAPLVIDIQECLLKVLGEDFEAMPCVQSARPSPSPA